MKEDTLLKQVAAYYGEDVANILRDRVSIKERDEKTVEDLPLLRAVEIIQEDGGWPAILEKYHRDVSETQMAEGSAVAVETKNTTTP